jgi:hypothetical protein
MNFKALVKKTFAFWYPYTGNLEGNDQEKLTDVRPAAGRLKWLEGARPFC